MDEDDIRPPSGVARLFGTALPLSLVALAVGVPLANWGHLPDPVAVHFNTSGVPNGNMSRPAALLMGLVLTAAPAAWLSWCVRRPAARARPAAAAALLAGTGAMTNLVIVAANSGAARWEDARNPTLGLALVLILPVALAVAVYVVLKRTVT